MRLKSIEISGFKSFAKKAMLSFETPVTAVVGPNGSGKSNVVEAFRFVLGEQSMKSMRGKTGADLIFRGGANAPKLSRAAVSITFDNSDNIFSFTAPEPGAEKSPKAPILFDTITFTRELFADGTSRYLLNGTEIRLKQMIEMLGSVNIGSSSHHIISQGEADGILRANARDRREILEDALGLKIYHYRIRESEQKLAKTQTTLKEVQSLRRELAPHLRFLEKQVEKIEKGRAIRTELEGIWSQYLAAERAALAAEDIRLTEATSLITHRKLDLEIALKQLPEVERVADTSAADRARLNEQLAKLRETRRAIESRIGRLEGMIEAGRAMLARESAKPRESVAVSFAPTEYQQLISDLEYFLHTIRSANDITAVQAALIKLEPIITRLREREPKEHPHADTALHDAQANIAQTVTELEGLQHELSVLVAEEEGMTRELSVLENVRESQLAGSQEATRRRYEVMGELTQCQAELQILAVSRGSFVERKNLFDAELKEAAFLFGPNFLRAIESADAGVELNLHDTKRSIERLKIRLDEHAGIGNEVVTEYESARERDVFLAREVTDIENSIRNLEALIIDLKKVLDERFTGGVTTINERFGEFFKTMFGGGSAFLSITLEKKRKRKMLEEDFDEEPESGDDEQLFERGIDVHVNLPEKKVKELQMLSGGERSLVSIALLFAISQVNPPPFLVLDETDAALDEANSRRYGDMVERLSEYSQLIVVTHNRETMSRASVLYGVTLGTDGGSKLLSIKFDEAVKVAK